MQKVISILLLLALPLAWSFRSIPEKNKTQNAAVPAVASPTKEEGSTRYGIEGAGPAKGKELYAEKLPGKDQVKWITLAEAEKEYIKGTGKAVLIDLYTDWCGWCKVMDKKTYSHPEVVKYINEHFIPVKLDAETKDKIKWMGKEYNYQQQYKVNMYAVYLTDGQLSFPTTVFIPAGQNPYPQAVPGFLEPKDIESLLKYFGDGHYGKTPFNDYIRKFTGTWK